MSGAHDWIEGDPAGGSRALANLNPRATLHVFNKSGHIPFAEEPEGFVDVLRGWLRGLRLTELA
jgi:pimeloyl-ACP methyl ester carboxylesterase